MYKDYSQTPYRAPYLIQRLHRRDTYNASLKSLKFSDVFSLDYMGAAEFEFGAFPAYIRKYAPKDMRKFTHTIKGRKVFGLYDPDIYTADQVMLMLDDICAERLRLKESTYLEPFWQSLSTANRIQAWVDIENGTFWAYENMTVAYPKILQNSVAYMDEKKKQNS